MEELTTDRRNFAGFCLADTCALKMTVIFQVFLKKISLNILMGQLSSFSVLRNENKTNSFFLLGVCCWRVLLTQTLQLSVLSAK